MLDEGFVFNHANVVGISVAHAKHRHGGHEVVALEVVKQLHQSRRRERGEERLLRETQNALIGDKALDVCAARERVIEEEEEGAWIVWLERWFSREEGLKLCR